MLSLYKARSPVAAAPVYSVINPCIHARQRFLPSFMTLRILSKLTAPLIALTCLLFVVGCSMHRADSLAVRTLLGEDTSTSEADKKPLWVPWSDCRTTFGNPTVVVKGVAKADGQWQADNLVMVRLPWKAHAAWNRKLPMKALQVHRLAAPSLTRALNTVWLRAGKRQAEIDRLGLSSVGGGYNWRTNRKGAGLSTHAYGCAVDFDPDRNGLGDDTPNLALAENHYVVEAFRQEGWSWGGSWRHPDGMHFQAARVNGK